MADVSAKAINTDLEPLKAIALQRVHRRNHFTMATRHLLEYLIRTFDGIIVLGGWPNVFSMAC